MVHKVIPLLLNGIKQYRINSVLITMIIQARNELITKERMTTYSKDSKLRKIDDDLTVHIVDKSVNDDLETFFEASQIGKYSVRPSWSYFLPKLTTRELELIEMKDESHLKTYSCYPKKDPDVSKKEMELSESTSKFLHADCYRWSFKIENGRPVKPFLGLSPRREIEIRETWCRMYNYFVHGNERGFHYKR